MADVLPQATMRVRQRVVAPIRLTVSS